MKVTIYENILNKERYHCIDVRDIQVIDGVEFLKVFKDKFDRSFLIRKDTLKKISAKNISGYGV